MTGPVDYDLAAEVLVDSETQKPPRGALTILGTGNPEYGGKLLHTLFCLRWHSCTFTRS